MRWINDGTVRLAMGNRVNDFHGEPSERSPRVRRCLQGEDRRDWRGRHCRIEVTLCKGSEPEKGLTWLGTVSFWFLDGWELGAVGDGVK